MIAMSMWRRHHTSGKRGQTLVMVGLMMMVLLALAGMALDVGEVLWTRGVAQNAADAAVLAGVRELPEDPAAAQEEVAPRYAALNLGAGISCAVTQSEVWARFNTDDALTVTVSCVVPPGLRAAVGAGDIRVGASATAVVARVADDGTPQWGEPLDDPDTVGPDPVNYFLWE